MNKLLAVFGILLLTGAGCAASVDTKTNADTKTNESASVTGSEQNDSSGNTDGRVEGEGAQENSGVVSKVEIKEVPSADEKTQTTLKSDNGVEITVESTTKMADDNVIEVTLGEDTTQTIDMEVGNFFLKPNTINAKAGDRIKIKFAKNAGFHTFVIDQIGLNVPIEQGESVIFTAPSKPGTYEFYCDIGSHKSNGMVGSLIVK